MADLPKPIDNRGVGGRLLPYTVGMPRYDDDPFRGQRRRPWMTFRVGGSSMSLQPDTFLNFVVRFKKSMIEAGVLLDEHGINLACIERDYQELRSQIQEGLDKTAAKYDPGPMSTPIVLLILDNFDAESLEAAVDDYIHKGYYFKLERDEILEMIEEMEYDKLDEACVAFAQYIEGIEGLPESLAQRIPIEDKPQTFGVSTKVFGQEVDPDVFHQQLANGNQMRNRPRNRRRPQEVQKEQPQNDPLDYQKELDDDEVPPLTTMDPAPPGLAPPGLHQNGGRQQNQQNYRGPTGLDHNGPPGLTVRPPPGIEYNRPPGLSTPSHHNHQPQSTSSNGKPESLEVDDPNVLSYEEVKRAKKHLPPEDENVEERGSEARRKHHSLMSRDLNCQKLMGRLNHPFIHLAHNLDLLHVINYAVSTREKSVLSHSKTIITEIFNREFEQKLHKKWLARPFVTGEWNYQATTLVFEIMMLFFNTARFQNGFMLTIESYNECWLNFIESYDTTNLGQMARAGVTEREFDNLKILQIHIDKWINAAKTAARDQPRRNPEPSRDETDFVDRRRADTRSEDLEAYNRRRDENFRKAQEEEEARKREEPRKSFGSQGPSESRSFGGPETSGSRSFGRQPSPESRRPEYHDSEARNLASRSFGRQQSPESRRPEYHDSAPRTFGRQPSLDSRRPEMTSQQFGDPSGNDSRSFGRQPSPYSRRQDSEFRNPPSRSFGRPPSPESRRQEDYPSQRYEGPSRSFGRQEMDSRRTEYDDDEPQRFGDPSGTTSRSFGRQPFPDSRRPDNQDYAPQRFGEPSGTTSRSFGRQPSPDSRRSEYQDSQSRSCGSPESRRQPSPENRRPPVSQNPPPRSRRMTPSPPISEEEFLRRQAIRFQKRREQDPTYGQPLGLHRVGGADSDYGDLDLTTTDDEAPESVGTSEDVKKEEKEDNLPTIDVDAKPRQPYVQQTEMDGEYQPMWMKSEKTEPPEDFRTLTAVPTLKDYVNASEPYLRRIVELGVYTSADHYLDVQFRLLREDLVSPMRDGLDIYRKNGTCKGRRLEGQNMNSDISITNIERVDGKQVTDKDGWEMRIIHPSSFDISKLLENDREMKESGLVMLSCDRFVDDFHLGHIQTSVLAKGQLHLAVHEETAPFQPDKSYMMAEATSYLPAYEHVLNALKTLSPFKPIPFERYLVHGRKEIYRPNFHRFEKSEEQIAEERRLERIYNEKRSRAAAKRLMADKPIPRGLEEDDDYYIMNRKVPPKEEQDLEYLQLQEPIFRPFIAVDSKGSDNILIDQKWYKVSKLLNDFHPTNMDESQRVAFCNTFKHELSLIQGPPGTGKTHIGVQIVKTMLHNRGHWKITSPILVVCFTNSGLDNLLERIHQMILDDEDLSRDDGKPKMIRYGMKCESDYLKRQKVLRFDVYDQYRGSVADGHISELNKTGAQKRKKAEQLAIASYTLFTSRRQFLSFNILQRAMKPSYQDEIHAFAIEHVDSNDKSLNADEALACWLLDRDFGKATRTQSNKAKQNRFQNAGAAEDSEDEDKQFMTVEDDDDDEDGELDDEKMLDKIFKKMNLECSGKQVLNMANACNLDEYHTKEPWIIAPDKTPEVVPLMGVRMKNRNDTVDNTICELLHEVKSMIHGTEPLTYHELNDVKYIFSLTRPKRWALYMHWCEEVRKYVCLNLPEQMREYHAACQRFIKANARIDAEIMKMPMIVGCTTTGCSRLRPQLEQVQPRILIVEEAAEVLEAHILSAMISSVEHCVMIGDHKQLQPNPAVHELAEEYGMKISMFERLVERALPYSQLREQHRMNPLISDVIVKPAFYDNVIDADNVFHYPPVEGMATNLFMWSHKGKEQSPDGISWYNTQEVAMTVSLVRHLLKQSYTHRDIVVLTTYAAQRNFMTREFPGMFVGPQQQYEQGQIPVHTVDSFQGREGKVVIVSLVRSHRGVPENTGIGFLAVPNRICVALTRAQHGMYVIGNAAYLSKAGRLWNNLVNSDLDQQSLVAYEIPIKCVTHGNVALVKDPVDFNRLSPEGGCLELCDLQKPCGHICRRRCHPNVDSEHDLRCEYQCERRCPNPEYQHRCMRACYEDCGQCMHMVVVRLACAHQVETPCSRVATATCDQKCNKHVMPCHHKCSNRCGEPCITSAACQELVLLDLECGHKKPMKCAELTAGEPDFSCNQRCENRMLTCQHQCAELCGQPCTVECQEPVKVTLSCKHQQDVKCCNYDPNRLDLVVCKQIETKMLSPCGHFELIECNKPPSTVECTRPCPETIAECGHICGNLCGTCFTTKNHLCQQRCPVTLDCGHSCMGKCSEPCAPCKSLCKNRCEHQSCGGGVADFGRECSTICALCVQNCSNRCAHRSCTRRCYEECDVKTCNEPCAEKLACGHACLGLCGEVCPKICGTCTRQLYTKAVAGASPQRVHRLIHVPKCSHVHAVEVLDEHVKALKDQGKYLTCCYPGCGGPLNGVHRYAKYHKKIWLEENMKKVRARASSIHHSTYDTRLIEICTATLDQMTQIQPTNLSNDFYRYMGIFRHHIAKFRGTGDTFRGKADQKWRLAFLCDVASCYWAMARLISTSSKFQTYKRKNIPPNVDQMLQRMNNTDSPFSRVVDGMRRGLEHVQENFKSGLVGAVLPKLRLLIARMTLFQMLTTMCYELISEGRDVSDAESRELSKYIQIFVGCEQHHKFVPRLEAVEKTIVKIAPHVVEGRKMATWSMLKVPDF
ncbi:hypothetical protein L3Y34_016924 [Caenorhabditis briggsae]|uniref:Uncharacterized protein n=2 Tax=Caenorhabditis briggsae TaxID=6238 RepID=A0AAE9IT56_CAEBR|nr:hypothetical protein L3Y34_016924 [Caenorhabditis briggsae]